MVALAHEQAPLVGCHEVEHGSGLGAFDREAFNINESHVQREASGGKLTVTAPSILAAGDLVLTSVDSFREL